MSITPRVLSVLCSCTVISACTNNDQISNDTEPFGGISETETVMVLGTEPFWDITVDGGEATFKSADDPTATTFDVARFAGNNGLSFNGEMKGQSVLIAITPGSCSDGMSDRDFPYTATVNLGDSKLEGCAYTDLQPFEEDDAS